MTVPNNWIKSLNSQTTSLKGQAKKDWAIKKDGEISKAWLQKQAQKNTVTGNRAKIFINKP